MSNNKKKKLFEPPSDFKKEGIDTGKLLSSKELEDAVLGSIILEQYAISEIIQDFNPEVFYFEPNKLIAECVVRLYKTNTPIDILTVSQDLKTVGTLELVGGSFYVSSLTNRIASSSNLKYHYKVLQQYSLERILLEECNLVSREIYSYGNDVFDVYDRHQRRLEDHLNGLIKKEVYSIKDIHLSNLAEQYDVQKHGKKSGVYCGLNQVDRFTSGWQKPDLIILAARPAMGKTTIMLNWALHSSIKEKIPTAIFSLEQSNAQITAKAQSILSGLNVSRILKKQLTEDETKEMDKKCSELYTAPLYLDDTPSLSLLELRAKARRLVHDKGVGLIIVDYLQLMTSGDNQYVREQEVSTISRGLKGLAKELEIPIIALSQLSREVEKRADKKPMLSDLRESGSLEQDSDSVIFIIRPEVYDGYTTYDLEGTSVPTEGLGILIWAKHRGGEIGEIPFTFIGSNSLVGDYSLSNFGANKQPTPPQYQKTTSKEFDIRTHKPEYKEPTNDINTSGIKNNVDFLTKTDDEIF